MFYSRRELEMRHSRSNGQDKQNYLDFKPEIMNKQEIARRNMMEVGILEGKNGVSGNLHIRNHPVPVLEIPSLASVDTPTFWYKLALPLETISRGALSVLQLESVIHACQRHTQRLPDGSRAGFLVGDGAGLGKGRIAAAIIFENFLRGRKKSIWLSVSNEQKYDAKWDLRDIGADGITFHHLYTSKRSLVSGDVFSSIKEGVVFSTFSNLTEFSYFRKKYQSTLEELLDWCGQDFDGVIIFDECHQTKKQFYNDVRTGTNIESEVLKLQTRLPNARIVYMCATGISEPINMEYMTRLGLWGQGTAFNEFGHFVEAFEDVGSIELVGMEMKQRGMYLARQLSFEEVVYDIFEVDLDRNLVKVYDKSVELWVELHRSFTEAEKRQTIDPDAHRTLWLLFWAAHSDFFKYLCISAKIRDAALIAREAVKDGKCVVIGVQTNGELPSQVETRNDGCNLSNVISTAQGVLECLVRKHFPLPSRGDYRHPVSKSIGGKRKYSFYEAHRKCKKTKTDSSYIEVGDFEGELKFRKREQQLLLEKIGRLGTMLPGNWIDELIYELGGSSNVAEISSRKGRAVVKSNGQIRYESRAENGNPLEKINSLERGLFMTGKKNIAVITEVAGISLQEDRRLNDPRPRVYISLECPPTTGLAIQQFGCVHRTGRNKQVCAPEFNFLYSSLAGEKQLALNVAKKTEVLCRTRRDDWKSSDDHRTDRRSLETIDATAYFYSEYGRIALDCTMRSILGYSEPFVPPPRDYTGNFFEDVTRALAKIDLVRSNPSSNPCPPSYNRSVSRFIRRIVGIPVELQTRLFQYFSDTLSIIISRAMVSPDLHESGITDIGFKQEVHCTNLYAFSTQLSVGPEKVELYRFEIDRGVIWSEATGQWSFLSGSNDGFYSSKSAKSTNVSLVMQKDILSNRVDKAEEYLVMCPNSGLQLLPVSLGDVKQLQKISPNEAKPIWNDCYQSAKNDCFHIQLSGYCSGNYDDGFDSHHGLRRWECSILRGPLLSVWREVKSVLKEQESSLKVGCVHFQGGNICGLIVPSSVESRIIDLLVKHYNKTTRGV